MTGIYFTIAWRNLVRNRGIGSINIIGLSIGLACCLLITLFVFDEITYDRFHANYDQLYRIKCAVKDPNEPGRSLGIAGMIQGPTYKEMIPEIEDYNRLRTYTLNVRVDSNNYEESAYWTDPNFFQMYSFPLLFGSSETVLKGQTSIVITEKIALKYFGTVSAVGKTIELDQRGVGEFVPFTVSGVAKNPPDNSSIQFSLLMPIQFIEKQEHKGWNMLSWNTFVKIRSGADIISIESRMQQIYLNKAAAEIERERKNGWDGDMTWGVQAMRNMHLQNEFGDYGNDKVSNPKYSYILGAIALFILLIACINFVNLSLAQSLKRAKEIGVRKAMGSKRREIFLQFIAESALMTTIAFVVALGIAEIVLPLFNKVAQKELSLLYVLDWRLSSAILGLFVLTVITAGIYPAVVVSGMNPIEALYSNTSRSGKQWMTKGLVVVQFALAIFLSICTLFIYYQYDFMLHKDVGYSMKGLVKINTSFRINRDAPDPRQEPNLGSAFRNELRQLAGVESIAQRMRGTWLNDVQAGDKRIEVSNDLVDEDIISTLQVPMVEGRFLSRDFPSDANDAIVVNEAFAKAAGWSSNPIGKQITYIGEPNKPRTIVGVVRDYHAESLRSPIKPQVLVIDKERPMQRFIIRVKDGMMVQTLRDMEQAFRKVFPYLPYKYAIMEEEYRKEYDEENRWRNVLTFASFATLMISGIGLLGLTMLAIARRTKEIGIRKVLGASVASVMMLVSRDFLLLVSIGFVLAVPLAYMAVGRWLQDFAYRVAMTDARGILLFCSAGIVAGVIAFAMIALRSFRVASANPVESLRTE